MIPAAVGAPHVSPLVVSAAELRAGAVGHTLDLEAHGQADEVVRALAGGPLAPRPDQTQVTTGEVVVRARVLTWRQQPGNAQQTIF